MHFSTIVIGALATAVLVASHPGEDHHKEAAERRAFMMHSKKSLAHCADKLRARGHQAAAVARRTKRAVGLSKRGVLKDRDLSSVNVSHHSTESYNSETAESTIFSGNNSCVLSPEVTEGPYYVAGEYIRKNHVETQEGVALTLDLQVVDVNTCEPVPNAYLEIWHCNSTGVYSGVSASGNGNSDQDTSNLDATFLRGVQLTDDEGAVQFDTLFPGHYTGRTTHTHVMVHLNASAMSNGTLMSTTASHVGQIFYDQDLITQVEATVPYNTNTQDITTNAEDNILQEEAESSDPFVEYVFLGDSVEDGIFAWLGFGIDTSVSKSVSAAATLYAEGGQANANSGMGGGGGPPGGFANGTGPGNGTGMPSGGSPSGFANGMGSSSTAISSTSTYVGIGSAVPSSQSSGAGSCRAKKPGQKQD